MIQTTPDADHYADDRARLSAAPALQALRDSAYAHFRTAGFPTQRDEDWRFTNVKRISGTAFRLADPDRAGGTMPDETAIERHGLDTSAARLVFVNGRFDAGQSTLSASAGGLQVTNLARAATDEPARLAEHLGRHAATEGDAFAALNTAFLEDGAVVMIPQGTVVDGPIEIIWITRPEVDPTVSHPRTLVVAGANSQATVVETWIGPPDATYFTNAVSEIVSGPGATIDHYKVVHEGNHGLHVGATRLDLDRDATIHSHTWTFGGALVRNNLTTVFGGTGGHCDLNGLYLAEGTQLVDNHLEVLHASPHCDSREYFKGILDDKSRAVFTGRIIVSLDAQKTDAKQTNMNLLLSDHAQVDTKPQLEIFADDVKCTHGATIGQLDADAIFYMRSRGIPTDAARDVLTFAFASELLERVSLKSLRRQLHATILERLPQGELLPEAV